jgi:hypothetical protein
VGIILAASLIAPYLGPMGHDQAWGMYMGRAWLNGTQLYGPTLVEVNPPFIVWFMSIPVLLARLLHLSLPVACNVFFDLVFLAALAWSLYILSRSTRSIINLSGFALGMVTGFLMLAPSEDFGERDPFAAILLVPYVLLAAARLRGLRLPWWQHAITATLAVTGVCLKPHYLLLLVAAELVLFIRPKTWRLAAAPCFVILLLAIYAGVTYIFYSNYLHVVVPEIRMTYHSQTLVPHWRVNRGRKLAALAIVLVLVNVWRKVSALRTETVFLLGAAGVSAWIYYLQAMGSRYHAAPTMGFCVLAFSVALVSLLESNDANARQEVAVPRPFHLISAALACIICLCVLPHFLPRSGYESAGDMKQLIADIYRQYPVGTPVSYIAEGPWEFPAVLEQEKLWASRYMHTWWMGRIVEDEGGAPGSSPERAETAHRAGIEFRHQYGEDLQRWHPAVVLTSTFGPAIVDALHKQGFDGALQWFCQDDLFRSEWAHYQLQRTLPVTTDGSYPYVLYVYVRKSGE